MKFRLTSLGVALLALISLLACDASPEPSATPGPTASQSPSSQSTPAPCAAASPLDLAQRIRLSLSVPGCLVFQPGAEPAVLTADTYESGQLLSSTAIPVSAETRIPPDLAPFDAGGCWGNGGRELRISGTGSAAGQFAAHLSCGVDQPSCPDSFDPSGSAVTTSEDGETCVRWKTGQAADSFRVEIRYPSVAVAYAFSVDAGRTSFLLPHDAAPRLFESGQRCRERKDFVVFVFAQRAGLPDTQVAYASVSSECSLTTTSPTPAHADDPFWVFIRQLDAELNKGNTDFVVSRLRTVVVTCTASDVPPRVGGPECFNVGDTFEGFSVGRWRSEGSTVPVSGVIDQLRHLGRTAHPEMSDAYGDGTLRVYAVNDRPERQVAIVTAIIDSPPGFGGAATMRVSMGLYWRRQDQDWVMTGMITNYVYGPEFLDPTGDVRNGLFPAWERFSP